MHSYNSKKQTSGAACGPRRGTEWSLPLPAGQTGPLPGGADPFRERREPEEGPSLWSGEGKSGAGGTSCPRWALTSGGCWRRLQDGDVAGLQHLQPAELGGRGEGGARGLCLGLGPPPLPLGLAWGSAPLPRPWALPGGQGAARGLLPAWGLLLGGSQQSVAGLGRARGSFTPCAAVGWFVGLGGDGSSSLDTSSDV